ncbi:hypothetical protein BLS_001432 [Venturia inaequalis]|uniref:DUF1593-domain-containing protein n=1 Tax=Venturia inaequalis TaxID=5025 RepID=A0A8H3Z8G7_VENIN|nr:hypothetical protein BLS_001432 [Venturia inaequalis]KAE9988710.1 hypothetical protein EG328_008727 [Venturia inaequalis]KAE9989454.1 hypothetical protein EG327_002687 [Venturia inaequalis]RDI83075.1 hypothetical protein Vi05172_g6979 [Venturia inaequalis]
MHFARFVGVGTLLATQLLSHATAANTTCDPLVKGSLPQVFILTDISNEPDDQESLVRLLVHSDLYNITGLAAVTSYWLNFTTYPDVVHEVVSNYSTVRDQLQSHTTGSFPTAEYLRTIIHGGSNSYGLAALQEPLSNASSHLISVVDSLNGPLYIQVWGGANVLSMALNHVSLTRSQSAISVFISKLRIYAISDQDNSGFWIRARFPSIHYISSSHAWNYYGDATWPGISGEAYYSFDKGGPDTSLVTNDWLAKHIQVGPFGASTYITPTFIMEGDSPSLLFTVQNGLNVPEHPEYGGWGGRYKPDDLSRVSGSHFGDTFDFVRGANGETFVSNKATIWRWREAFQAEFAARMQWTIRNSTKIQHPPVAVVNGNCGFQPLILQVDPSKTIDLDASSSSSRDDMQLSFNWTHYREISLTQGNLIEVPEIPIVCKTADCKQVSLTVPNVTISCATSLALHPNQSDITCKAFHIILAVKNRVELGMTRYKRVILEVKKPANLTVLEL